MHLSQKTRDILFWLIFLANMGGAIYGFTLFYGQQLLSTPLPLWPFTPDCPLFALLFALSMLVVRSGMKGAFATLFNYLTFAGALKYGFWTVFVLTYYRPFYTVTPMQTALSTMLAVSHVFLFFEAFLLASYVRPKPWHLAALLGFFLLSDWSDYVWLTYPPVPEYALQLLFPLTVAMSLVAVIGGYLILRRAKRPLLPILQA